MKKCLICICAILFFSTANATTWYVHPDSVQNCIQDCLDACSQDDTVLVGPGTYYENIVWPYTQGIKLMSEYGPDTTIIDGGSVGSVIEITTGGHSATVISGLKITDGSAYWSGGIYCDMSSPTIAGNIITGNHAAYAGGGITLRDADSPQIIDNIISNNTCDTAGAGIAIWGGRPKISRNTIRHNTARWGGGIYSTDGSFARITWNTIDSNTAYYWGGGIGMAWQSRDTIKYNIITDNFGGTYGGGGIYCTMNGTNPYIDSCTISRNREGIRVYDNASPTIYYCNITDNEFLAIHNLTSTIIDADSNWWGDATGPYHPTANPGGLGDTVSDFVEFDPWLTDSVEGIGIEEYIPKDVVVTQLLVYPNPFSKTTTIRCEIRDAGYGIQDHSLYIYDISGRLVKSFDPLPYAPSPMQITWDGTDYTNRPLPSGVYFLELQGGEYSRTAKLLLVR